MADFRLLARTHAFMKLSEIIISIICLILLRSYGLSFGWGSLTGFSSDRYNVGILTIGGMLLISLPLLISYIWTPSGTYQPFLELVYNSLGFILFLTTGALVLDYYCNLPFDTKEYTTAGKALGALCIINSLMYLIDAVLALKQGSTV
jgi:hypothetical protein